MEAAQAEALSQILGQTATREDLGILRAEMNGRFAQIDEQLASMQLQLDMRLQSMEDRIDRKLAELESRLTWRIVGAMAALTAIFSAIQVLAR